MFSSYNWLKESCYKSLSDDQENTNIQLKEMKKLRYLKTECYKDRNTEENPSLNKDRIKKHNPARQPYK